MENLIPSSIEGERAVLSSIIQDQRVLHEIGGYLHKSVFYKLEHSRLYELLLNMSNSDEPVDLITICGRLTELDKKNGIDAYFITDVIQEQTSNPLYYARQIFEKYLLRKVIVYSESIKTKAKENTKDVYDSINEAHSLFGELLDIRPSKIQDIEDVISDTLTSIKNKTSKLIKTGYNNIDKFSGGLTRGEVTIIGGRPGHGKTTVMINMLSKALEQGHRAMFFSRELPNSELMKKILCLESEQLSYSMVRKNIFTEQSLNIVNNTIERIRNKYSKEQFLMFDNVKDFSASSAEVKRFKPDIIFDDYIQLISCEGYNKERRLQIEKLVNNYKWLAKENESVVVLASQLNRFIERNNSRGKAYEPQLSDLAESGAIEQVAENVFFSYYDYKVTGEAGKGKNVITLIASKVRYGESGYSDLGYDGDKCKLYNSIEEMVNEELPFGNTQE